MSQKRLNKLYRQATPSERLTGRLWYSEANLYAQALAKEYSCPIEQPAAILAVLSPNVTWETNKTDARRVMLMEYVGADLADFTVSTYNANKDKAWRIATGENPLNVVRGPKVTAFWRNIMGDLSLLTLDSHAMNAWCGERVYGSNLQTKPRVAERKAMLADYYSAAKRAGEQPAVFQAILWTVWKRQIDEGKINGY